MQKPKKQTENPRIIAYACMHACGILSNLWLQYFFEGHAVQI